MAIDYDKLAEQQKKITEDVENVLNGADFILLMRGPGPGGDDDNSGVILMTNAGVDSARNVIKALAAHIDEGSVKTFDRGSVN